jgi:hypothetical protein
MECGWIGWPSGSVNTQPRLSTPAAHCSARLPATPRRHHVGGGGVKVDAPAGIGGLAPPFAHLVADGHESAVHRYGRGVFVEVLPAEVLTWTEWSFARNAEDARVGWPIDRRRRQRAVDASAMTRDVQALGLRVTIQGWTMSVSSSMTSKLRSPSSSSSAWSSTVARHPSRATGWTGSSDSMRFESRSYRARPPRRWWHCRARSGPRCAGAQRGRLHVV